MNAFLQLAFYTLALVALAKPLGAYMADVYEGKRTFLSPVLGWLERLVYRVSGVNADEDMDWKRYLWATLWLNLIGFLSVYGLQRLQHLAERKLASVDLLDQSATRASLSRLQCEGSAALIREAEASLDLQLSLLDQATLRAPFAGVVAEINGEPGEVVTPSPPGIPTPPAVDLIDDQCLYVEAPIVRPSALCTASYCHVAYVARGSSMYSAGSSSGCMYDSTTRATSAGSHTSVTFCRCSSPAVRSSASRPTKSWSNLTTLPYPSSRGVK